MTIPTYTFIVKQRDNNNPHAAGLLADAHTLGFNQLTHIEVCDCYFIQGHLTEADKQQLATRLFCDPVAQIGAWQATAPVAEQAVIETALRPGVTDPVAEQIQHGAQLLGIKNIEKTATGQRFILTSTQTLNEKELHDLAQRLFANAVIQYYAIGALTPAFSSSTGSSGQVETLPLRNLNHAQLNALAQERRSALDEAEMQAIQHYYQSEQRDPTDIEFETIAQTWSEHCSHKTFKAIINTEDKQINGLLNTFIRRATEEIAAPWVWSAFVDNAGIIDFDDEYQISFKVETHNHPSAIEPFGGANTGLGGVIRDVLGVSAKPIAATDIFCFGPQDLSFTELPEGTLHPRRIRSGVVAGVQDYGNKTGIPTVNGAIYYDEGYIANPLVYCGCVGLAPKNKHPRDPQPGDRVIVLGGRTGRDGLRGATFSSMTMDAQTGEVAGASVQIGDPIIAKGLIEVITRACDAEIYHAITDCGAGGLSSAVGEMASNIGADVELNKVPLKYAGLAPWEIWLSEAQERMVLAVPSVHVEALQKICDVFNVELTDMGWFTGDQLLVVRFEGQVILRLSNNFLHHDMPQRILNASVIPSSSSVARGPVAAAPYRARKAARGREPAYAPPLGLLELRSLSCTENNSLLLALLAHPNIASKEDVIRLYDHEVQGGTVVKPLTGAQNDGPADGCVLKPVVTKGTRGIVLSNGLNPEIGKWDPYAMAVSVIDEAIRNAVAVGADPKRIAILDNFCWGDPKRPETLGALVAACEGCYDAAIHYQTPFISGKDSLNNEYVSKDKQRHAIPSTLLISAIGIIEDVNKAVTLDFKTAGNIIYLLGNTYAEFAGSHFIKCGGQVSVAEMFAPGLPEYAPELYANLHQAMQKQYVRACHDLSEGGLAVALAEMCIAGRLGCAINLIVADATTALFSESNGRLLVEIMPENCAAFEACFAGEQAKLLTRLGEVTAAQQLMITQQKQTIIKLAVNELVSAWQRLAKKEEV